MGSIGADPALLLQQLQAVVDNPDAFTSSRKEIIRLSRKASLLLEDPFEMFQRLVYSPLPLVTARVAQNHNVFKTLVENENGPTSAVTLAEESGIQPGILDSLLQYMSTHHMIEETSPQHFSPTKMSNILMSPLFVDGVIHFHDNCLPAFQSLNHTLSHPTDPRTAFEIGQNSAVDFYTWLETHPIQSGAFHRFMEAQFATLPTWLSVVDFENEFGKATEDETPVLVDVGGGKGQQILGLQTKSPSLKGRYILQETPAVLAKAPEEINKSTAITKIAYDYLTPQPILHARAYYFRQIFHNNDDATCLKILASHIPALSPESVILIDDKVLPDDEGEVGRVEKEYPSALALAMLVMFKGVERKEGQWRRLIGEAGLEIKSIRQFTDFGDSVIVVGLPAGGVVENGEKGKKEVGEKDVGENGNNEMNADMNSKLNGAA
ncbi:putative sterigmatocystin 8-O-methyltransferase precursor [Halenospora varia]|nr:putative sterigmatocystin 8-O-methyltransferase precursor [Halenospora varia]